MNQSANIIDSTCAETWFVATDAGAVEYSLEALKGEIEKGAVRHQDLVWRQGMNEWVELDHVPLLRMLATTRVAEMQAEPSAEPAAPAPIAPTAIQDEVFDDKTRVDDSKSRIQAASVVPAPIESTEVLTESFDDVTPVSISKTKPSAVPVVTVPVESTTICDETASVEPPRFEPLPVPVTTIQVESTAIFDGLFDVAAPSSESKSDSLPMPVASIPIESTANMDDLLEDGDATIVQLKPELPESARPPVTPTPDETRPEPAMFSIGELALRAATSRPPTAPESRIAKPTFARPVTPKMSVPLSSIRPVSERPPSKTFSYKPPAKPVVAKPSTRPLAEKSSTTATSGTAVLPHGSAEDRVAQAVASLASKAPNKPKTSLTLPKPVSSARPPPRSQSAIPPAPSIAAKAAQHTPPARVIPSPIIAVRSSERKPEIAAAERSQAHAELNRLAQSNQVPAPTAPTFATTSVPAATVKLDGSIADQASVAPEPLFDSIYPSISSIKPAAGNWNRSRRPLLFVAGAISVAVAIAVVVNIASPKHSRRPATATRVRMPSVETPRLEVSTTPAAGVATQSLPSVAPTTELAQLPETTTTRDDETRNVKGSSLGSPSAAPETARTQQKTARSENSTALQHELEPKKALADGAHQRTASQRDKASRNVGESNAVKSPQSSGQPSRSSSDSVATWDQGTVEHRAWMSPGF